MQTWEYAPQYALRTFAYLFPIYSISKLLTTAMGFSIIIKNNKVILFQILRCIIGGVTGYLEVRFANSLQQVFSQRLSLWCFIGSIFSAGMFHSSCALLPSSTVMQLVMISYSSYVKGGERVAVVWGLFAVLCTGWPFCAVLWVPMGLYILYEEIASTYVDSIKNIVDKIREKIQDALLIQTVVSYIDYIWYNRKTIMVIGFPTLNILLYNTTAGGDELYGVEPLSYYIKNLLLNWNGLAILASFSIMPLLFSLLFNNNNTKKKNAMEQQQKKKKKTLIVILVPMYLWILIVFSRPHKEERFLFPIYPLLSFACAFSLDSFFGVLENIFIYNNTAAEKHTKYKKWSFISGTTILLSFGLISIFRSCALSVYYTAPLSIYQHFHDHILGKSSDIQEQEQQKHVCVCGEWHRFPSSFHLPSNKYSLAFLPSSFKGQLPATSFFIENEQQSFNDMNQEETSRYLKGGIDSCDYVVELIPDYSKIDEKHELPECLQYMNSHGKKHNEWNEMASYDFLDAEQTTGVLDRVLYLPWRGKRRSGGPYKFAKYALFQKQ